MKKYLELKDEKSAKFWEIEVEGSAHTVRFGRIGTKGQSKTKEFPDEGAAQKDAEKLIASKMKKGYRTAGEAGEEEVLPEQKAEDAPFSIAPMTRKEVEKTFLGIKDLIGFKGDKFDLTSDVTLIEVDDLTRPEGLVSALDKLLQLVWEEGLEKICNKWLLNFAFKDSQERYLNEAGFFPAAVALAPEKVVTLLNDFTSYHNDFRYAEGGLYGSHECETALIHAAWALATRHPRYLAPVLSYLKSHDWDHNFNEQEEFLKDVKAKNGPTTEYMEFLMGLTFYEFGEHNYFPDELEEGGVFARWICDKANWKGVIKTLKALLSEADDPDYRTECFCDELEKKLKNGALHILPFAKKVASFLKKEDYESGESFEEVLENISEKDDETGRQSAALEALGKRCSEEKELIHDYGEKFREVMEVLREKKDSHQARENIIRFLNQYETLALAANDEAVVIDYAGEMGKSFFVLPWEEAEPLLEKFRALTETFPESEEIAVLFGKTVLFEIWDIIKAGTPAILKAEGELETLSGNWPESGKIHGSYAEFLERAVAFSEDLSDEDKLRMEEKLKAIYEKHPFSEGVVLSYTEFLRKRTRERLAKGDVEEVKALFAPLTEMTTNFPKNDNPARTFTDALKALQFWYNPLYQRLEKGYLSSLKDTYRQIVERFPDAHYITAGMYEVLGFEDNDLFGLRRAGIGVFDLDLMDECKERNFESDMTGLNPIELPGEMVFSAYKGFEERDFLFSTYYEWHIFSPKMIALFREHNIPMKVFPVKIISKKGKKETVHSDYGAIQFLTHIDAVDRDKTIIHRKIFEYYGDGDIAEHVSLNFCYENFGDDDDFSMHRMFIKKVVLKEREEDYPLVFRLSDLRETLFVSGKMRKIMEEAGIKVRFDTLKEVFR